MKKKVTIISKPKVNEEDSTASSGHKINDDILNHNRKRAIDSKLFELADAMTEQGYTEDEIRSKLANKRKILESELAIDSKPIDKGYSKTDSHEISSAKLKVNERMRKALKI